MARKSIFDILSDQNKIDKDVDRLDTLFLCSALITDNINPIYKHGYTLKDFVEEFCFQNWKNKGLFLGLYDFLESLDFEEYYNEALEGDIEAFLTVIEVIFNCWKMAELFVEQNDNFEFEDQFYLLHDIMEDFLSRYNHKAVYNAETEQLLVVEDKPEVTAVAEIIEPALALELIRYNHHSMRGNIAQKKSILTALGAELEPRSKELAAINSSLKDNIFFMLNNLNIRHNNCNPADKGKYKEYVAKMESSELEAWYDELYQMILLAFLELDQLERNPKIKELKTNVVGG